MGGFAAARRAVRKPPRVVTFPPSIFMDRWSDRPTDDVAIGLRVPGDYDVTCARANAARLTVEMHPREDDPARIDCLNDALIREVCALGMCDANNVFQPYFPSPEDDVRSKLSSEGAKRIFDEIERLQVETSPVHREADEREIDMLSEVLQSPESIDALPNYKARRAKRLIAFLLDELLAIGT